MKYEETNLKQTVCSAVVITTAQLHSTKPVLRFCTDSNYTRGVSEIRDGEDLWQWSRLEIRLNAFRRSPVPQKQFIINSSSQIFLYVSELRQIPDTKTDSFCNLC